jgi:NAD-dependent SIR2 family protein deacetylase
MALDPPVDRCAPLDGGTAELGASSSAQADRAALLALVAGRRVVALAGAGLSTESGIPDYRGTGRSARTQIQHRDFVRSERTRARYWARSFVGWVRLAAAEPNAGHRALAALERAAAVSGVITQNVDGLHQRAGSSRVVELHGTVGRVRCLGCGATESRAALQERLRGLNPSWDSGAAAAAPDGDAQLDEAALDGFRPPACLACGGVIKPDVVLFGDNVAPPVLAEAWRLFDEAEVLLVLGSSLSVWSGFRFVRRAAEQSRPVAIVNLGPTRGDALARLRLAEPLGQALPALAAALGVIARRAP